MAPKALTTEAIAMTEKKMDMTLDDIIKMSKGTGTATKAKNPQRSPNKNKKFFNAVGQDKALRVRRFMDSRSSLRQGVLAQRRSNFQGNQFPLATEAARKAVVAPIRNRAFGHSRIANMTKPRVGFPPVQRRTVNGGFAAKQQKPELPQQQGNVMTNKQRPHTLDSLFANMKEQRLRVMSRQNNSGQRNGGGQQRQPWRRGRF